MPGGQKFRVNFEGEEVEAEIVDIVTMNENQNSYMLSDGTSLSMRTVVVQISRIVDRYDNEGNPIYVVRSQNVTAVSAPDKLRKKGG